MSDSDETGGIIFWCLVFGAIWYFWTPKLEDRKDYLAGYDAGRSDGYYEGRVQGVEAGKEEICDEVESRLNYGAASAVGC